MPARALLLIATISLTGCAHTKQGAPSYRLDAGCMVRAASTCAAAALGCLQHHQATPAKPAQGAGGASDAEQEISE